MTKLVQAEGNRVEWAHRGLSLVDTRTASRIANMKGMRPPSARRSEIRILPVFDPWRSVVLLVAGDKSGQRERWYRTAIPRAEQLYDDYLAEPPNLGGYPVPHAQGDCHRPVD